MILAFLYDVMSAATPCRASAAGCPTDNVVGIIIFGAFVAAVILGVFSWISSRWGRGPLPWILRTMAGGRSPSEEPKHTTGDSDDSPH